jgi:hypothetical protein
MTITHRNRPTLSEFQGLNLPPYGTSGTEDDDDGRDDEHAGENEAPARAADENTETSEEFEVSDEYKWGDPEVDPSPALRIALLRLHRDPRSLG